MSFLAPLFLLGGLAIALPVVFHLIRRSSRVRTPFSSLMFLGPTPPRVSRRSRLEDLILLALRCLVLGLIALAFGRPYLPKAHTPPPDSATTRRLVILVDTSASMRREQLWAQAQAAVRNLLAAAAPQDQVALMVFDRAPRRLMTFEQWSVMPAGERVDWAVQQLSMNPPGWFATHLGEGMVGAVELIEEGGTVTPGEEDGFRKQLIIVTDLQEGSRLDGLQELDWPKNVEVTLEVVKPSAQGNAGMQLAADTETSLSAGGGPPRVRVTHSGDAKHDQFKIRWAAKDGTPIAGSEVDAYVPAGQSRIVRVPPVPPGASSAQLVLSGDEAEFDNRAFYIAPIRQDTTVLYFGNERDNDPSQPLFYLKRGFQDTTRQRVEVHAQTISQAADAKKFDATSLFVVTDMLPVETLDAIRGRIENGATLLFMLKSASQAASLARLLRVSEIDLSEADPGRYALLGEIDLQHPILSAFADPRFSDFTRIHFWKHRRLGLNSFPGAQAVARFDDHHPALVQLPAGKGKIVVLTSGWHPGDSQLALSTKFVPLLYSILEGSMPAPPSRLQLEVGAPLPATPVVHGGSVGVRKPNGAAVQLNLNPEQGAADSAGVVTDEPGIYRIEGIEPPLEFAVNLAFAESKTQPLPQEELERLGVPFKTEKIRSVAVKETAARQREAVEVEGQQKLWRKVLLAALILLVFETWFGGWLSRRSPVPA